MAVITSFIFSFMNKGKAVGVVVGLIALTMVVVPVASAAPLLSQVNQAMRNAGIAVTGVNQLGWAEGVVVGHYRSYQQLVDAMNWHKQHGRTIPDGSKFTKAVVSVGTTATGQTKCRTGNVTSLSKNQITITKPGGNVRIGLTAKQHTVAVGHSIVTGNQVKACSKDNFKHLAGNLIRLNEGTAEGGGGGGGSSGGGGGGT